MSSHEIERVGYELGTVGYSLTSYEELGLPFDTLLAAQLCIATTLSDISPEAMEVTKHFEKTKMKIVQSERALLLGRQLITPVVERLFVNSEGARNGWSLFGLNYYERDGDFGAHRDSVDATVLVVTASGTREFNVYKKETEPEKFIEIEKSFTLVPGSIMILDAIADPGHSVYCKEGPSVAAVFDVPDILR